MNTTDHRSALVHLSSPPPALLGSEPPASLAMVPLRYAFAGAQTVLATCELASGASLAAFRIGAANAHAVLDGARAITSAFFAAVAPLAPAPPVRVAEPWHARPEETLPVAPEVMVRVADDVVLPPAPISEPGAPRRAPHKKRRR